MTYRDFNSVSTPNIGLATIPVNAEREGQIQRELGILGAAINELGSIVSMLETRLNPVLGGRLLENKKDGQPEAPLCAVASEVRSHRYSVERLMEQLRTIHGQVEI